MSRRALWIAAAVFGLVAVVGLGGGRLAFSEDVDTTGADIAQMKRDIATLLENQTIIINELKNIREDLKIVKIRCSS